jgi:hypothetical protein
MSVSAKRLADHAAWRALNPEKVLASVRKWQDKNPAKVREYESRSRANRRERRPGEDVARATAWVRANPDRHLAAILRRGFGITLDDYRAMMSAQGGVCAICLRPETSPRRSRLTVDHCHRTGRVRGLLCSKCNVALGYMGDDPGNVERALSYLRSQS